MTGEEGSCSAPALTTTPDQSAFFNSGDLQLHQYTKNTLPAAQVTYTPFRARPEAVAASGPDSGAGVLAAGGSVARPGAGGVERNIGAKDKVCVFCCHCESRVCFCPACDAAGAANTHECTNTLHTQGILTVTLVRATGLGGWTGEPE